MEFPCLKFQAITSIIVCLFCLTLGSLESFGIIKVTGPVNTGSVFWLFGTALAISLVVLVFVNQKEKAYNKTK